MKIFNFFKKKEPFGEAPKIKKKKPVKKKNEKPTREIRFSRRKVMKYVSMLVFLLIGLSVFFNFVFFNKYQNISNTVSAGEERIDDKLAEVDQTDFEWNISDSVVPFSEEFLNLYYNVPSDEDAREERLQLIGAYFVNGFDTSRLEVLEDFVGERNLESVQYVETEYRDRQNMNVHFYIVYEITDYDEEEDEEVTIMDSVEIVIPVVTDGEGYAVKENPSLIDRDLTADISLETEEMEGENISSAERQQLQEFLEEFFTSYGVSDDLLPFMTDESGLEGKIFDSLAVRDSKILDDESYQVIVDVVYRNEETSFGSMFTYYLTLTKDSNNYFVDEIKQGGF